MGGANVRMKGFALDMLKHLFTDNWLNLQDMKAIHQIMFTFLLLLKCLLTKKIGWHMKWEKAK